MKQYIITLILLLNITIGIQAQELIIIHTNDTHSRIEPLPDTDKYNPDLGGVVRRAAYIEKMRKEHENVLLFDAGDFVQGTPYFNMFKGDVEVEAMNILNYDAVTLGNHEFDYGMDVLTNIVKKAKFPIVCTNYDFSQTEIASYIKPYHIIYKNGVKIGILGANINPVGLIASTHYDGMKFLSPIETANKTAEMLRKEQNCDVVICLSHLGYRNELELAEKSHNIDIIIGGHSHTFMTKPVYRKNLDGNEVLVFQTSGRGAYVGRIDVKLQKTKRN
ncbi:MAG: metallophosphoesterase [Dysgonamonadaceae bacterium]|nr:metallophosphoesterase [Dysgonamonadaceae bacterium]MDD4728415.1 metallophosphoesterase [Dysgonamonadaceae bacterium]